MSTKTLIFSDAHLTHRADPRKLAFLIRIIDEADKVIINGDFWDSHLTTSSKFTQSPAWQSLFALLKEKQAVYIYGNHDAEAVCLGFENIFSSQQFHKYEVEQGGTLFHIEHGNRIAPDLDETIPWIPPLLLSLGTLADEWGTRFFGKKFLAHYKKWNKKMKMWQKTHIAPSIYLITGHSHFAELSPEIKFANSGSIRAGLATYLVFEGNHLELKEVRY